MCCLNILHKMSA